MENLVGKMLSVDKMDKDDEIIFSGVILVLVQTRNTVVGVNVQNPFPTFVSSQNAGLNTFDLNQVDWEYDENETPEDNVPLLSAIYNVLSERISKGGLLLEAEYKYIAELVRNVIDGIIENDGTRVYNTYNIYNYINEK